MHNIVLVGTFLVVICIMKLKSFRKFAKLMEGAGIKDSEERYTVFADAAATAARPKVASKEVTVMGVASITGSNPHWPPLFLDCAFLHPPKMKTNLTNLRMMKDKLMLGHMDIGPAAAINVNEMPLMAEEQNTTTKISFCEYNCQNKSMYHRKL